MGISLETLALAAQMKGGGGGSGSGGSNLPSVRPADNGKVLTVKSGRWQAVQPEKELPDVTAANNGKILGIVNGVWSVMDLPEQEQTGSNITHLTDGSTEGSLRTINAKEEDGNYTIGENAFAEGFNTSAIGAASHAEGDTTVASGSSSHAEGYLATASGAVSHVEGAYTSASGAQSHAEGQGSKAQGTGSHAEGSGTTASGTQSHAEGNNTTASGAGSHAEGASAKASGDRSHAEGGGTTASGAQSHAEGAGTKAEGDYSHAEGGVTRASGMQSHAEGAGTIANHASQHVFGEYNVADTSTAQAHQRGTYVEIVGNGTSSAKSNARTLDWDGNEVLAGKLTVGAAPTADMDVATKKYVDDHIGGGGSGSGGGSVPAQYGTGTNSMVIGSLSGTDANTASGANAVAAGIATTATHKSQFVFGEFNEADPSVTLANERGDYIEIVGNGYDENSRANARTLDWNGNETLGGNITIQGGKLTLGSVELTAEKLEALLMMVG